MLHFIELFYFVELFKNSCCHGDFRHTILMKEIQLKVLLHTPEIIKWTLISELWPLSHFWNIFLFPENKTIKKVQLILIFWLLFLSSFFFLFNTAIVILQPLGKQCRLDIKEQASRIYFITLYDYTNSDLPIDDIAIKQYKRKGHNCFSSLTLYP